MNAQKSPKNWRSWRVLFISSTLSGLQAHLVWLDVHNHIKIYTLKYTIFGHSVNSNEHEMDTIWTRKVSGDYPPKLTNTGFVDLDEVYKAFLFAGN